MRKERKTRFNVKSFTKVKQSIQTPTYGGWYSRFSTQWNIGYDVSVRHRWRHRWGFPRENWDVSQCPPLFWIPDNPQPHPSSVLLNVAREGAGIWGEYRNARSSRIYMQKMPFFCTLVELQSINAKMVLSNCFKSFLKFAENLTLNFYKLHFKFPQI